MNARHAKCFSVVDLQRVTVTKCQSDPESSVMDIAGTELNHALRAIQGMCPVYSVWVVKPREGGPCTGTIGNKSAQGVDRVTNK